MGNSRDTITRAAQHPEGQEEEEEQGDEQTLHQAREWDDWKDTHPGAYGH